MDSETKIEYRKNYWKKRVFPPDRVWIHIPSRGVEAEDENALEEDTEDVLEPETEAMDTQEALATLDDIDSKHLEDKKDKDDKFRPIFLSSNAITLSDHIQLVIRFYGDAEEIHSNYDYVHCTGYWTSENKKTEISAEALESIISKSLHYQGSKYPLASVLRMRKFINRGWTINAGQVLKILLQVSELDLTDISVLEDQLIGVDTAYFSMMLNDIKKRMEEDDEFELSHGYVVSIVEKIF